MLHESTGDQVAENRHFGELDTIAKVKVRTEQAKLRKLLAGGAEVAECALCGDRYPLRFLVAAHIKKRAVCTDEERRQLHHIAMLACSFGCDALYESGWITVDQHGNLQVPARDSLPEGNLRDRLSHLRGRGCTAHSAASEPYFAWHRTTMFQGRSTT
ncbi:hypothetical protein [Amycolatopsis nigrescens]|uniref:hypothetical protein n=1 Tax=Amycolatopsis nigrescens TaxID=381445 RepID=UPI00035C3824|nr:hypothetical protein [Amycolatopsis nigrescens]